jgi:hypothetical protein
MKIQSEMRNYHAMQKAVKQAKENLELHISCGGQMVGIFNSVYNG